MELREYQRRLDSAKSSYKTIFCEFCGEETLSGTEKSYCSNCESVVASEKHELASKNPMLVESLDKIRSATAAGDFDTVLNLYAELTKASQSPQLLYCHGLAYVEYSNLLISKIRYDLNGFMESNARARDYGFKMLSEAKRLFAKSAYHSESAALSGNKSADLAYNLILCLLRIGELRRAKRVCDELESANEHADYSKMLLYITSAEYQSAAVIAERIAKAENPPINIFYYIAFLNFKTRKPNPLKMLSMLKGVIDPAKLNHLAEAITADSIV
jgi:hypothetical protein